MQLQGVSDKQLGSSIEPTRYDIEKIHKMFRCEQNCKSDLLNFVRPKIAHCINDFSFSAICCHSICTYDYECNYNEVCKNRQCNKNKNITWKCKSGFFEDPSEACTKVDIDRLPAEETSLLIVGGWIGPNDEIDTIEIIGKKNCTVPKLPMKIAQHSLILTEDNKILVCGGYETNKNTCLELQRNQWIQHSKLLDARACSFAVILSGKTYLLGSSLYTSSEWLETGTKTWRSGPNIGKLFRWGCTVKLSNTEVLLIGGYYTKERILKLDISSNDLTSIGKLQEGRYGHSCAVIDSNIVISGGKKSGSEYHNSTEVISMKGLKNSKLVGQLNQQRAYHKLIVSTINNLPTLLAIGGIFRDEKNKVIYRDSIEIWKSITETWTLSNTLKLSQGRSSFGALSVPTSLICQ